jgi:hypothetical protein
VDDREGEVVQVWNLGTRSRQFWDEARRGQLTVDAISHVNVNARYLSGLEPVKEMTLENDGGEDRSESGDGESRRAVSPGASKLEDDVSGGLCETSRSAVVKRAGVVVGTATPPVVQTRGRSMLVCIPPC